MRDELDEVIDPGRIMGTPPHEAANMPGGRVCLEPDGHETPHRYEETRGELVRRASFEAADRLQRNLIREWLALDPFGGPQRRYRRACSCGHNRYCGPGCGAHTE